MCRRKWFCFIQMSIRRMRSKTRSPRLANWLQNWVKLMFFFNYFAFVWVFKFTISTLVAKSDPEIQTYSKQLHLTLAYNFEAEHKRILEELANQYIDFRANSDWELRLYSRDIRAESKLVSNSFFQFKYKFLLAICYE